MIELKNYTKTIKGAKVLDGISATFEDGTVYGLQGRNGSGKTMLMRAICGLIRPTEGCVIVDGKKLSDRAAFPKSIGVLIESPAFIDSMTGTKNLELIASIKGVASKEDIEKTLDEVGLDPADRRRYRKYSLGMKQRLGIAAAIMEKPRILLLDEPLNALDTDGIERVRKIISRFKESGAIVILACHDSEELEAVADVIYRMEDGVLYRD